MSWLSNLEAEPKPNQILKLKNEVKSRFDRRQSEFEEIKLLQHLMQIEKDFVEALFADKKYKHYTYEDMYCFFLDRFTSTSNWIQVVLKPKYYEVNRYYFVETFEPAEYEFIKHETNKTE